MTNNPWLDIPLEDYEGHMEAVGQTAALRQLFGALYTDIKPRRLAVLGCTAGADFDAVDPAITDMALGLDLNGRYLQAARERASCLGQTVQWVCGDVLAVELPHASFDLIHASLLLEYVDPGAFFRRVRRWLAPNGYLSTVTRSQLPSCTQSVPQASQVLKAFPQ